MEYRGQICQIDEIDEKSPKIWRNLMRTKAEIEMYTKELLKSEIYRIANLKTSAFIDGYLWALNFVVSDNGLNPIQQLELWVILYGDNNP